MDLGTNLKEKLERKIDSWNAELEAAEAKAKARQARAESEAADAELETQLWGRVKALRERVRQGRAMLEQLADAGEDKAREIKAKVARLFD
jgi:hypothetical protein